MFFFFQAEDGIRDLVRSRGLGDVYKRQLLGFVPKREFGFQYPFPLISEIDTNWYGKPKGGTCLLYTSDAADERSSVDLGGRRIIKKKNKDTYMRYSRQAKNNVQDT